jgi:hypothetical protein
LKYREYQFSMRGPKKTVYARIKAARVEVVESEVAKLLAIGCKRIVGFPEYFVSPEGDVYSTSRNRFLKLQPGTKAHGYRFVGLRSESGIKYKMVHRLVAEAFIPNPLELPAVNHLDCNKNHNSATNLEWTTPTENSKHALRNGRVPLGEKRSHSKLTNDQVIEIRSSNESCKVAGRRYGVCAQVICNVRNRKTYASVP